MENVEILKVKKPLSTSIGKILSVMYFVLMILGV